ncbi:MAG: UPF0164 family protein [Spirochaetales bacterium]
MSSGPSRITRYIFPLVMMVQACAIWNPAFGDDWSDFYGERSADLADSRVWREWFTYGGERQTGLTVFPLLELSIGGERQAMGNAYTAVAGDLSGIEANPAATATLPYTEAGVFHRNYIADTSVEAAAGTIRFGDLGIGANARYLHVPFTGRDDRGRQTLSARYTEMTAAANVSYNFFRSYRFHGLSLGMNTKVAHRSVPETIASGQSATSVLVDIGALTRFNFLKPFPSRDRNTSVGVAARNFGTFALDESPPSLIAAGFSYGPLRPITLAFDTEVPVNLAPDAPSAPLAVAAGARVDVTGFFTARGGVQLKGGNPRMSLGGSVDFDEVSIGATYTLDLVSQLAGPDNFTIEARFNFGDRGRQAARNELEDLYLEGVAALSAGDPARAVSLLEQALDIDPRFEPAAETLRNARRARELEQAMQALGDLEELDQDPGDLLRDNIIEDMDVPDTAAPDDTESDPEDEIELDELDPDTEIEPEE